MMTMKYVLLILAVVGITASSLALREHYRTDDDSPCSINSHWDCGIVNKSPYAMLGGIPVADIGIAGYAILGALALRRSFRIFLAGALGGLAFSLYLAHIERDFLGVWCVYCVISLATISLMTLLSLITVITQAVRKPAAQHG
jgi:vitamin-K-epoxide reductase (warfarin-sensitive)